MLTQSDIHKLFELLNNRLKEKGEVAEIGIIGGATMALVFNARVATKDVDAVFEPAKIVRQLAQEVGEEYGVGPNWLNDAAKAFIEGSFKRNDILNLSNLRVWAPEPRYMLAMKCISARWDSHDKKDVEFLINYLKLTTKKEVFRIIESYFLKKRILPKTQFLIEELFMKR